MMRSVVFSHCDPRIIPQKKESSLAKVIVIGAGAAGMMAAGQAASAGSEVLLLEKMSRSGNKIRISGRGRCNLTNTSQLHDFIGHFNREGRFLHQPFSHFFVDELTQFFTELGLPLVRERGGRIFPASGRAGDVVEVLLQWLDSVGVELRHQTKVREIVIDRGRVTGVRCDGKTLNCTRVVLAAGGASYPATGSSGDGYRLAAGAGHTVTDLRPALIPLVVDDPVVRAMAGLDLKNIGLRVYVDGKRRASDFGEAGFTRFGIGGPVILTHSRMAVDALRAGKKVAISLDLKPALDESKLDNRLQRDLHSRREEKISSVLRGLVPREMVPACLHFCAIDAAKSARLIDGRERMRLRRWLKDFRMDISGHRPLAEAIVTAGGIPPAEITAGTMESTLVRGLYLCGELLDIDGDTGGYNLQAAFSTGWLAGRSAAAADAGTTFCR